MAVSDWLPLAATLGGSAVGLAGVIATARSSRRQLRTTVKVAELQARHQAEMAWWDRRLTQKEGAYGDLLDWMTAVNDAAEYTELAADGEPEQFRRYFAQFRAARAKLPRAISRAMWNAPVGKAAQAAYSQMGRFDFEAMTFGLLGSDADREERRMGLNREGNKLRDSVNDVIDAVQVDLREAFGRSVPPHDSGEDEGADADRATDGEDG